MDDRANEKNQIALRVQEVNQKDDISDRDMKIHGFRHEILLKEKSIPTAFYPASDSNAAIMFAFHGGGFCFGGYCAEDWLYDALRNRLGINVVSVGYRKNVQFPAALDDCYDAVQYYLSNLDFDFDRNRISMFGSSAGANLALTVSMRAYREQTFHVEKQILNYPYLDLATPSIEKGTPKEQAAMEDYFAYAYTLEENRKNPFVSPVYAQKEDLDPSTQTLLLLAEKDVFHKEGNAFGEKLRNFGFPVHQETVKGMSHGYLEYGFKEQNGWMPPHLKAALEDGSIERACEWAMQKIETFYREEGEKNAGYNYLRI